MPNFLVKTFSGKGQIFKAGEFLCNVTFSYRQIGNPKEVQVKIDGELVVEECRQKSLEILNGLFGVPIELRADNGDTMDIFASNILGSYFDGRYRFVPMAGGNFPVKELS